MKHNDYARGRLSAFKECFDAIDSIMKDKEAWVKHVNVDGEIKQYCDKELIYDYARSLILLQIDEKAKIQGKRHAKKKEVR